MPASRPHRHDGPELLEAGPARRAAAPVTAAGPSLSPVANRVLHLQRSAGNHATAALLGTDGRGVEDDPSADGRAGEADVQRDPTTTTGGSTGTGTGSGSGSGSGTPAPATPVAVRNGPRHSAIDTSDAAGMRIAITLTSSTGTDADMASVQDSEQVSSSLNHTGSYATVPSRRSNNSGYMAGYPVPDDRHSEAKADIIDVADNKGGDGSFEREQCDTWKPNATGTEAAIPASGYVIKRTLKKTGTQIKFTTEKSPRAVTVNGFTTTAGPSPTQSEEVTVRA